MSNTVNYPRPEPEQQPLGWFQHMMLSGYWFGSNFVWGALLGVMLASQVETFDPLNKATLVSYLQAFGAFWALVVPLIAGPMSDKSTNKMGRRRPYILFGGAFLVVGLAIMMIAFEGRLLPLYFIGYLVLQFGSNVALAAYSGVIPDVVPAFERGAASGMMALMTQIGTLAGVLGTGPFLKSNPMMASLALISFAILGLLMTLYGLRNEKQFVPPEGVSPGIDWKNYFVSLVKPFESRDFAWVWITRAMVMMGFYAIQLYILYYLKDVIGIKDAEGKTGFVIGIILIFATISGIVGGKLSDIIGRKIIVFWSSVLLGVFTLGFYFCKDMNHVLVLGSIFGLAYGAYISVDWALGTDVLPSQEDAGKDMAVWHVAMTLPQQIAPLISGKVLSMYKLPGGGYALTGYGFLFAIAAMWFVLGGVFLKQVKGST